MNGKPSLKKTLSSLKKRKSQLVPETVKIGSWAIKEDENGDLVLINYETKIKTIISRR